MKTNNENICKRYVSGFQLFIQSSIDVIVPVVICGSFCVALLLPMYEKIIFTLAGTNTNIYRCPDTKNNKNINSQI